MTKALTDNVLLIGWDAADWKVMTPLMDAGHMPNLSRLVNQGVMGNLATLQPILSPMLWTTIATGKRSHKHGIHGFIEPDPVSGGVRPITNLGRKTKALWNIFNQEGLKSNVIAWWPSNPVEPINGVMVSNLFHQAKGENIEEWDMPEGTVHPVRLNEGLKEFRIHPNELDAEQLLSFVPEAKKAWDNQDKRLYSVAKILAECSSVHAAATATMQLEPWDFMGVYFDAIDHFSHGFMKYHPPRLPWIDEEDFELYKGVVDGAYRFHDIMLGVYMELAGEDTTIIIVSDHGFHPDHLRPKELPNEPAGAAEEHRHFGMIAAMGPGIRKDELVFGASLLDITPTILALMGKPVGRDMDGRPLVTMFDSSVEVDYIDSWDDVPGDDGSHPENFSIAPIDQHEALKQLADLGYIDEQDADQTVAVEKSIGELRYNLARDLLDSGKLAEAMDVLQKLWQDFPEQSRFGVKIFDIQLRQHRPVAARITFNEILKRKQEIAEKALEELKSFEDNHLKDNAPDDLTDEQKRNVLKLRRSASANIFTMNFLEARLLEAEGRLEEALDTYLKVLEVQEHNRPHLYQCIGELLQKQKKWTQAIEWFNKILDIDNINPVAHLGLASSYLAQRKNKRAMHEAKAAVGLQFHNPKAHFVLGVSLHRLNELDGALQALNMVVSQQPLHVEAHKRLAHIYGRRLFDISKAAMHEQRAKDAQQRLREIKQSRRIRNSDQKQELNVVELTSLHDLSSQGKGSCLGVDEIVIVSGLPRSGTSMMMQLLHAGGISIFSDHHRQADDDNPKGYYEHEKIKGLAKDASWLDDASGQAIKVVTPLIPNIPADKKIRVIYMERDLREILASQSTMLDRLGKKGSEQQQNKLAETYQRQVEQVRADLQQRKDHLQLLAINYVEALKNPQHTVERLNDFFGGSLNTQAMFSIIDPALRRQKIK